MFKGAKGSKGRKLAIELALALALLQDQSRNSVKEGRKERRKERRESKLARECFFFGQGGFVSDAHDGVVRGQEIRGERA